MKNYRFFIYTFICVVLLFFIFMICDYIGYIYNAITYKNDNTPIVISEFIEIKDENLNFRLPKGLVLYPLDETECPPELYDGNEYKIYVKIDDSNHKKITDIKKNNYANLIYFIDMTN